MIEPETAEQLTILRQSRRDERTRRLEIALAQVHSRLSFMPTVMNCVSFQSRLNPPMTEQEVRTIFNDFNSMVRELEDSASAFMCFCDCKTGTDEEI